MARCRDPCPREVFGEALGSGTFGAVYKGSYHGRPVAIKQLFEQGPPQGGAGAHLGSMAGQICDPTDGVVRGSPFSAECDI